MNEQKRTVKSSYEVKEIANMLSIPLRTAYDFCKKTDAFKVVKVGSLVRINKESFDKWFNSI